MAARIPVVVPQLGVVEWIVVVEWIYATGDAVAAGEPIVVIETEKAETEIEAPADGTLEIVVDAGDEEHEVGTVLGYVVTAEP
jgi:pyruvate dehydrogenase E2 component (dihydrolipoamide acetyltransferase)/2-oxoglutarate dehydrogenase E2 component (dihydrolipoamide succinyltransferase)